MSQKGFFGVLFGVPAVILLLSVHTLEQSSAPPATPHQVLLNSGDLKWVEAPPTVPKGAKVALVFGDPTAGPYAQFVKVPKGYVFPPHFHSQNEWITVVSGRVTAGFGGEIDLNNGKELTAGSFGYIPAATPHWALARTEVLFYQYVGGVASVNYVNPADHPRNKAR